MLSWNHTIFWEWRSPNSWIQALTLLFLGEEGPFLPFNPDGVFAFTSNIDCYYTVESSYKGKRTVTHRLYHVSLQTGWMGQLKSKTGWLEISVYFIININCPRSVQWYKYWSQQWWHSFICYTSFSLWRPWNMMRVALPASDDIFTSVVVAFLIKVSNFWR